MSFFQPNIFLPISILSLTGFISLFYWIYSKNSKRLTNIILLFFVLAFIFSFLKISYAQDINSILIPLIISLGFFSIISTSDFISNIKYGEYYFLVSMLLISSIALITSNDLFTVFISIEMLSMSLYGLVGFYKKVENLKAVWLYFILGSFASIFMIISLFMIYFKLDSLEFSLIRQAYLFLNNDIYITIGLILFFAGLLFKIALVPFSFWAMDVYYKANTDITMMMTSFVKLSAIIAAYKIFLSYPVESLSNSIYLFIVLTLLVPNLIALGEKDLKKIIVYSSISHAGYIAISFLGLELWQVIFYAIIYSISAIGIFSVIILLENNYGKLKYDSLKGLYKSNPFIALSLAIFLFSLSGVPPLSGFFAKFYVLYNALTNGHKFLVLIAVIASAISLYYYLKILIPVFMEEGEIKALKFSNKNFVLILGFAILILCLGIFSNPFINLLKTFYFQL